jgi:hypothetical protein
MNKDNKLIYEMYAESASRPAPGTPTATTGSGQTVLILPHVLQHIESQHGDGPGQGSVFHRTPSVEELSSAISQVDISAPTSGALYEIPMQNIGADLVDTLENAMKLPGAQQTTTTKEEREPVEVPAVTTTASMNDFVSNVMTLVLRPTSAEFLPDDLKQNPEILQLVGEGQVYALLSAWPGKATIDGQEIPPASQWNGAFAVIIPQ